MSMPARHTEGTFTVDTWQPDTLADDGGLTVQRVHLTKTFDGGMAGTGIVDLVSASVDGVPTAYVAIERLEVSLDDRSGRFLLQHAAPSGDLPIRLSVVPGSGREGLAGLRGEFSIAVTDDGAHTYSFDYDVDAADG